MQSWSHTEKHIFIAQWHISTYIHTHNQLHINTDKQAQIVTYLCRQRQTKPQWQRKTHLHIHNYIILFIHMHLGHAERRICIPEYNLFFFLISFFSFSCSLYLFSFTHTCSNNQENRRKRQEQIIKDI